MVDTKYDILTEPTLVFKAMQELLFASQHLLSENEVAACRNACVLYENLLTQGIDKRSISVVEIQVGLVKIECFTNVKDSSTTSKRIFESAPCSRVDLYLQRIFEHFKAHLIKDSTFNIGFNEATTYVSSILKGAPSVSPSWKKLHEWKKGDYVFGTLLDIEKGDHTLIYKILSRHRIFHLPSCKSMQEAFLKFKRGDVVIVRCLNPMKMGHNRMIFSVDSFDEQRDIPSLADGF